MILASRAADTTRRRSIAPLLAIAGLVALSSPAAAQRVPVRDSAGVAIVEHRDPAPQRTAFKLSHLPILAIGSVTGDRNYEFGANVPAAMRFADGRIVVADADQRTVRVYSKEGRYLTTLGRAGEGVGEYGVPSSVFVLPGDTVAVVDSRRADAILLFTADGKYQRLERTRTSGFVSVLANGEWLTRLGGGSADSIRIFRRPRGDSMLAAAPPTEAPPNPGRAGRRGVPTPETGTLLATLPGRPRPPRPDSAAAQIPGVVPIASATAYVQAPIIAGLPDGFIYGDPARNEIREYSATGTLRRIIRRDTDLRLTREEIERYKAAQRAGREGNALREVETRLATMVFPATRPAFQRILVDDARRLWVQDYEPVADLPLRWTVFDATGRILGTVITPPKFRLFEVGDDYVLGRWRDREGGTYVHLFGLTENKDQ